MSEENKAQEPQQAAQPVVNVEEIITKVSEAATKTATEAAESAAKKQTDAIAKRVTEQMGRAMLGEKTKSADQETLEMLAETPIKTLAATKDVAVRESVQHVLNILDVQRKEQEVKQEFVSEFPELKSGAKQKLVTALVRGKQEEGKDFGTALRESYQEVVNEFGLKSVKEAQRNASFALSTPGGGAILASPSTQVKDEKTATTDFLKGLRDKAASVRNRK